MNRDYACAVNAQLKALKFMRDVGHKNFAEVYRLAAVQQVDVLKSASPFFWNTETVKAVRAASQSVPGDTRLSAWNLPCESAWWWFESLSLEAATIDHSTQQRTQVLVRALSMGWLNTHGFLITPWAESHISPGELYPCALMHWPVGDTLQHMLDAKTLDVKNGKMTPAAANDDPPHDVERFVLAAMAWLEQRIVIADVTPIHRAQRREFQRVTQQASGDPRVVHLRRTATHTHRKRRRVHTAWALFVSVGRRWTLASAAVRRAAQRQTFDMDLAVSQRPGQHAAERTSAESLRGGTLTKIPKRENEIKQAYWQRFHELYPPSAYFATHHQDVRKSGYPDDSLHGFGKSSFWEFKHATPNFSSPGVQELTCARIARHGFSCLYVLFFESASRRRTLIAHPRDVLSKNGKLEHVSTLDSFEGHDFDKLAAFMHAIHRPERS